MSNELIPEQLDTLEALILEIISLENNIDYKENGDTKKVKTYVELISEKIQAELA